MIHIFNMERIDEAVTPLTASFVRGAIKNNYGYYVKKIDGLEPVKADISGSPYATIPGFFVQNTHVGKRNIVVTLGGEYYNPTSNDALLNNVLEPHERRMAIYQDFTPGSPVRISLIVAPSTVSFSANEFADVYTSEYKYYVDGIVESIDSNPFSDNNDIQISVLCSSPYFIRREVFREASLAAGLATIRFDGSLTKTPSPFEMTINPKYAPKTITVYTPKDQIILDYQKFGEPWINDKNLIVLDTRPGMRQLTRINRDNLSRLSLLGGIVDGDLDIMIKGKQTLTVNISYENGSPPTSATVSVWAYPQVSGV